MKLSRLQPSRSPDDNILIIPQSYSILFNKSGLLYAANIAELRGHGLGPKANGTRKVVIDPVLDVPDSFVWHHFAERSFSKAVSPE